MRVGSDVKSGLSIVTVVVDILSEREVDKISNRKELANQRVYVKRSNLNVLCLIYIFTQVKGCIEWFKSTVRRICLISLPASCLGSG